MEKTLKSEILYKGKKVLLQRDEVELQSGRKTRREFIFHPGSAAIIPILPDKRIILIKQYRYAVKDILYEIPAGTIKGGMDKLDLSVSAEVGETPLQCAHRELKEETGYTAGRLEKLVQFYPSPGISNELMHLFLAEDLKKADEKPSSDETIEVIEVGIDDAIEMIKKGNIIDAKTICGILLIAHSYELN